MRYCLVLLILMIYPAAYCQTSFIYLNGSNTNTEKSKEDFIKGVNKLHKNIMYQFSNDPVSKRYTGEINPDPLPFYWGNYSRGGLSQIEKDFDILSAISPKPAQYVRKFIALCLHDAIWVSRLQNMRPILDSLNETVKEEYNKGNEVVLIGYSAGTFIVHEYLFMKMPVILLKEDTGRANMDTKFRDYLKGLEVDSTCADAFFKSQIVTYDLSGDFIFEKDFENFKKKADLIPEYTKQYCAPNGVLSGVINHASPFALFYSGLFSGEYKINDLAAYSYKYVVENNMFWLNVNFSDDPLGFPEAENVKFEDVELKSEIDIAPNGGFIYDKSNKSSGRTFVLAHLSYYSAAKRFSKMLKSAINEGYKNFYLQLPSKD